MDINEDFFVYEGKHCYGYCDLAKQGLMCQCMYDRVYEANCLEHPGTRLPKILKPYMENVNDKESND